MSQARRVIEGIVRMLEAQGCTSRRGKGGSMRVKCPNGAVITIHATPRDQQDQTNMIRQQVRRNGLRWDL